VIIISLKLFFITGNEHKFKEVQSYILSAGIDVEIQRLNIPLIEIQSDSLENVAIEKVKSVSKSILGNYFIEDAGFFVEYLHEFPGVFSSYVQSMIGNEGILKLMRGNNNRSAEFRSVIALNFNGEIHTFLGVVKGTVSHSIRGNQGFGYDPIFIPDGLEETFAEISIQEKNSMSHRIRALEKLCNFLKEL
jgi:XTP/dITP diphosphohydrolase